MKTLLYIGNNFQFSVMRALGKRLEPHVNVLYAASNRNKAARLFAMVFAVLRHRRHIDCVLIDTYSTLNFWFAWIIALICRNYQIPYIAFLHGGDLPKRLENSPKMSRAVFGFSRANVAPSKYLQEAFAKKGYKTTLISNFIEIERYPFLLRQKLSPRLLWVRAFESAYNPEMAVKVFAQVKKAYPEATLCMVGPDKDGSQASCHSLAQKLGVDSRITFSGSLPNADWIALAAGYDIFMSTTHFDNTPISVMEAMALGLPVVSTNVGGVPFLIEHGKDGLLSPDNDVPAMAEHIQSLLGSPALAEGLSRNARLKAEKFDWKVIEKQWLDLLN